MAIKLIVIVVVYDCHVKIKMINSSVQFTIYLLQYRRTSLSNQELTKLRQLKLMKVDERTSYSSFKFKYISTEICKRFEN